LGALARRGAAPHNPGGNHRIAEPAAGRPRPAPQGRAVRVVVLVWWVARLTSQLGPCAGCAAAFHTRPGAAGIRGGSRAGRGDLGLGPGCCRAQLISCGRCGVTAPAHWRRRGTAAAPCPSLWRAAAGRRRRVRRPGGAGHCRPVAVSAHRPNAHAGGVDPVNGGQVQHQVRAQPRSPAAAGAAGRPQRRPGPSVTISSSYPPIRRSSVITHYSTAPPPASNACLGCVMLLAVTGRQSGRRYRLWCRVYVLALSEAFLHALWRGLWHVQSGGRSLAPTHARWRARTRARSRVSVPGLTPGLLRGPSQVGPHLELHPLLRVATRRGAPQPSSSW